MTPYRLLAEVPPEPAVILRRRARVLDDDDDELDAAGPLGVEGRAPEDEHRAIDDTPVGYFALLGFVVLGSALLGVLAGWLSPLFE